MDNNLPNLISVIGVGHNGTTLLARLINLHKEVFSFGDFGGIQKLKNRETTGNAITCGCGNVGLDCDFWSKIYTGSIKSIDNELKLNRRHIDNVSIYIKEILKSIQANAKTAFICEQMHHKRRVWEYLQNGVARIYAVHIVRDPRAVINSYKKQKATKISILSLIKHYVFTQLYHIYHKKKNKNNDHFMYIRIRYEDLCASPFEVLNQIYLYFNITSLSKNEQNLPKEKDSHIIGANGMKLQSIEKITVNTDYLKNISTFQWILITILTAPLLILFRYPFRRPEFKSHF
jgi:hypothetical protein